ncbi:MAG: nucleotide exchange factor GrpE [Luminiphilus sp.]
MKDDKTDPANEGEDAATDVEATASEEPTAVGDEPVEVDEESSASSDLEAELAAAKDAALRAQADAMNTQRRAEQEIEKARKFALERICGDLLSVVDNLERALEATGGDEGNASVLEGIELTRKGFMDVLVKYGVQPVDPLGEPFDPETAQAMSLVEQPDAEPNSVIAVMQKGYTLNGRLLRPAMVMVSKAPSA